MMEKITDPAIPISSRRGICNRLRGLVSFVILVPASRFAANAGAVRANRHAGIHEETREQNRGHLLLVEGSSNLGAVKFRSRPRRSQ